jgi:hypothetical protein
MQFCWDLMDVSAPTDFCRGKHKKTDNYVDNVSVGFFDGNATLFSARGIDVLQDSFHDSLPGYNSFFDAYDPDSIDWYSYGAHTLPKEQQLYVEVTDKDSLQASGVVLHASVDEGGTWADVVMTKAANFDPTDPDIGGEFYGTVCPPDVNINEGDTAWVIGTEVWYYVTALDNKSNTEYWPARAEDTHPDHEGTGEDYFSFSILPLFPLNGTAQYEEPRSCWWMVTAGGTTITPSA